MIDPYASPTPEPASRVASERMILLLLAAVQFTHIMDFMVMMPLGPKLMRELKIGAPEFGHMISAFGLAAGLVGLCMAPFIDRFDRRKLLLVCYAGFTIGTLACGLSHTPQMLLISRVVCGAFGGVSSAALMAIVSDVVPPERRARGMGIIMTAFSVAAALGVPLGLKLAEWWKWEAPFLVVAGAAAIVWVLLLRVLPPVRGHLALGRSNSGQNFLTLLRDRNAWMGLILMMMAVMGHFMVIPFLSPYLVGNVGMPEKYLFLVYMVGGAVTVFTGPLVGRLADRHGRFLLYIILVSCACVVVRLITASGPLPVWHILVNAALFFIFASGRFVPAQATISLAVPSHKRGAYMSLVSCSRDLASGATAAIAAKIVSTGPGGAVLHYDRLGLVAICVSLASIFVFRKMRMAE